MNELNRRVLHYSEIYQSDMNELNFHVLFCLVKDEGGLDFVSVKN